jgi:hypothetical protein
MSLYQSKKGGDTNEKNMEKHDGGGSGSCSMRKPLCDIWRIGSPL